MLAIAKFAISCKDEHFFSLQNVNIISVGRQGEEGQRTTDAFMQQYVSSGHYESGPYDSSQSTIQGCQK